MQTIILIEKGEKLAKILLIDDDEAVLRAMEKTLKRMTEHDVTTISSGKKAKIELKKQSFDLIVTDIIMPDIEGFELINHITTSFPESKIIAISGGGKIAGDQYLTVAGKIGAEKIMKKPFSGDELLIAVEKVMRPAN